MYSIRHTFCFVDLCNNHIIEIFTSLPLVSVLKFRKQNIIFLASSKFFLLINLDKCLPEQIGNKNTFQ